MNDYAPFRRGTLDATQLKECGTLRPSRVVRDTALLWAQIALVLAACAWTRHWAMYALAFPLIGTRYYALYIIGHDGLHRRLFPDARMNDLWNDLLVLGPIGAITRLNRHNHMQHHRSMGLASDPDRYKYIRHMPAGWGGFFVDLLGLRYVARAVRNVFAKRAQTAAPAAAASGTSHYTLRDVAILVGWQVVLFAAFTAAIGWWAYFVLWWGAVYVFAFCADVTRVYLEHAEQADDAACTQRLAGPAARLITYEPPWFERMLLAPMNMNHHVAHHLWPGIPYYNLPRATELLRRCDAGRMLGWRSSYFAQLFATRGRAST